MAEREQLEVGNNIVEAERAFADGYFNGSLYYYDTNHQLSRPFSSDDIYAFIAQNLHDEHATPEWNAGFVFGWITALCENNPEFFFTSIILQEA